MRVIDIHKGLLIQGKHNNFIGEIVDVSSRGVVIVKSYFDNSHHYINAARLKKLDVIVEPDNGQYYAYVPTLKGLHTCGDTEKAAYQNVQDAVFAYVQSMKKHDELYMKTSNFFSVRLRPPRRRKI